MSTHVALRLQLHTVRCKLSDTTRAAVALCDHQLANSLNTMELRDLQRFYLRYNIADVPAAEPLKVDMLPDDCMSCLVSQLYKDLAVLGSAAKEAGDMPLMLMAADLQRSLQNSIDEIAATGEEFEARDCSKPGVTTRALKAISQIVFNPRVAHSA